MKKCTTIPGPWHCTGVFLVLLVVSGCATENAELSPFESEQLFNSFKQGVVRQTCGTPCSITWGTKRKKLRELHDRGEWTELATEVLRVGFEKDLPYYYLGRSAEGLKKYEAARIYYNIAKRDYLQDWSINLDGFVFPRDIDRRLKLVASKLETNSIVKTKIPVATTNQSSQARGTKPSSNENIPTTSDLPKKRKVAEAERREKLLSPIREKQREAIAVIIGNKSYRGSTPEVDFAHNDADAMKEFVLSRLGYRDGNIIDLRDATRNEIEEVFGNDKTHEGQLFDWIKPGVSDVIVYYSGHGVPGLNDKRPYLLPVDGNANRAEITGFPVDVLYANLAKTPARSVTVYLDACFSGESPKGMLVQATSGVSVSPRMPNSKGRMTVITAAQGDQFASWDKEAKLGLFTKHLLLALEGKADEKRFGNMDGSVSLQEVQRYLNDEMTYQARRTWGRRQTATVQGSGDTVLSGLLATP